MRTSLGTCRYCGQHIEWVRDFGTRRNVALDVGVHPDGRAMKLRPDFDGIEIVEVFPNSALARTNRGFEVKLFTVHKDSCRPPQPTRDVVQ